MLPKCVWKKKENEKKDPQKYINFHSLDALDPLVLLLLGGGGHPVHSVLPLHHLALAVRLAGLDHLVTRAEQLEAVRLTPVSHLPNL